MKKKKLFIGVSLTLLSLATISNAYAHEEYQLAGITVTGERENLVSELPGGTFNRTGIIGLLGAKDIMDTPFQQNNLSEKTLNRFGSDPSQATTSILVNVPSVRTVSNTLYNDFSIRGQGASAYQMRINGVPGLLSQNNTPSNMFERIEVTSGPGLSITGVEASGSPGGIVNMVTKRAQGKDTTTYKTYFSGRSTVGNIINFSKRFGNNRDMGMNFNAALINGQTGIKREKVTNKNVSLNIDHSDKKSSSNLFLSYRDTFTEQAERYFDFTNKDLKRIPKAPDATNNYTFAGHHLGMCTVFGTLNHIQKIADDFKIFMNAGASFNNGYNYLVDAGSRLDILNDKGDFKRQILNEPYAIRNHYAELGLTKTFNINKVKNELTLSYSKDWYQARWGTSDKDKGTVTGNLYSGKVTFDKITKNINAAQYYGENEFYGLSAVDTLFFDNIDVMLGFHNHTAAIHSATGATTKSSATSPFFGFIYKPSLKFALFANHSESFTKGKIVGKDYENSGQILAPNKMKANEIGIKYSQKDIVHTLSYFDMRQANYMDKKVAGKDKPYQTIDGETKYRGIEYSMTGKLSKKLSLSGGFMYIDATYSKTNDTFLKGKKVQGVSDLSSVLTLSYTPNNAFETWGRLVYTGSAPLYNNGRKFSFDASTSFDLGCTYKSTFNAQPITYNLTVFNLFDNSYWLPRPTRAMGILSQPRVFYLGAELQL